MRLEVWATLWLPIGVDLGARYHRDNVLDPAAQGQGDRISKRFTNEIVSVLIELPLPLDKPTALWRYLPLPYLEI